LFVKLIQEVPELLVGFDTETTGLSTSEDEAISYGFAVYRSGVLEELSQFFAVPSRPMSSGAQRVHGISMAVLQRKLEEGEAFGASSAAELAATRLSQFASDGAVFVGSNPMFDFNMLESTLRRHGHVGLRPFGIAPPQITIIDVVSHDVLIEPRSASRPRRGLVQLCGHYGIAPGQHDAAEDARAAAEVLLAQIRRNGQSRSLEQNEIDVELPHDILRRNSRDQRGINATILGRLIRARRP